MNSEKHKKKEERALCHKQVQFKGKVFSVISNKLTWDDHSPSTVDIVQHPGAVALLPVDSTGHLMFVKQWRSAAQEILLEIPAGTLEPSESPETCAVRELQEEIGLKPNTLISLGGIYSAPGFCNEYIYLYLAKDLIPSSLEAEDTDEIDIVRLSLDKVLSMISSGEIQDSKTLAAICLYQQWLLRPKR